MQRPDSVGPFAICAESRAKKYRTELRFADIHLLARTLKGIALKNTERESASERSRAKRSNVKTAGEIFGDGTLIELVSGSSVPNKPDLLLWNGTKATIAPRVQYAGRNYEATELIASVGNATRLPSGCSDYGSVRELCTKIASLFTRHLGLPEPESSLLAYFAISSWFADCLPTAPGLAIYGPFQGQGINVLRLLRCLCRRPLLLADITPAGLRSLPMYLHPTLLINQPRLNPRMWTLLRTSSHRGFCVPAGKGGVLDVHGARAIFLGMDDTERITSAEVLHLSLANALIRSRGEIIEYSSAEVGWKLRQLGLSRSRDGAGKSLSLHKETSHRIHEWARSYGVLSRQNVRQGCPDCARAAQSIAVSSFM